ncbi:mandelate racemase/muconate lactonizing enzyme family protein [Pokkaliibacter sp. CJK22405]|uniref:mandelate racemase/muconate lactonizing enzyme family protein n=1 Tax=Pokkaliibacter sp. CJK22405 TaxID=3384615 RepID=UPI0039855BCB
MKIQRIAVWQFSRKLDGKAWNPAFRWTERRAPLLMIELDDGIVGLGEAWSGYYGVDGILQTLSDEIAPALLGCEVNSPREIAPLICRLQTELRTRERSAAWSAVDIALWDAFGQLHQQPLWQLLGGTRASAPVYASGGLYRDDYSLSDLRDEARSYIDQGFTGMKMKIAGEGRALDLERVAAVREGLGESSMLWVDAVNQLTLSSAQDLWKRLAAFEVSAMQSPLPAHYLEAMAELNQSGVKVIASEAEFQPAIFSELLNTNAVSYLQFCLPLIGGISGALELDALAADKGIRTTPQCFSTAVVQAATLHFSAASSNVVSAEYHCYHDHLKELYLGELGSVSQGMAHLSNAPGLGLALPKLGKQPDGSDITLMSEVF